MRNDVLASIKAEIIDVLSSYDNIDNVNYSVNEPESGNRVVKPTGLLIKDARGSDTVKLKRLSSNDMIQDNVLELGTPATFEVVGFVGQSILVKKDGTKYKVRTPQNASWTGVYLTVGDNVEVVLRETLYSGKSKPQYQLNYIKHHTVIELPTTEAESDHLLDFIADIDFPTTLTMAQVDEVIYEILTRDNKPSIESKPSKYSSRYKES